MTAEPGKRLRLKANNRLHKRCEFEQLKSTGNRLALGCLIINWRMLALDIPSRVGVITSRQLGSAVVRTRARRLLREAFRLHQFDFYRPVEMVMVARSSITRNRRQDVERDFLNALRQARLLNNETTTPSPPDRTVSL